MTDAELIQFGKTVRGLSAGPTATSNPFKKRLEEARRDGKRRKRLPLSASYTRVVQFQAGRKQRMSEVLEGLLQKRASLSAELRALDAGIAAYRHTLNGAAQPTKSAATVSGTRPTMSLAARKKLSLLAKARWAKKRKEDKK
jgi:hypothetical protein